MLSSISRSVRPGVYLEIQCAYTPQFTVKSLNRQVLKAEKDEKVQVSKMEKVQQTSWSQTVYANIRAKAMKQGHSDIARIYAGNAARKQEEQRSLTLLASRVDAVVARVQTAATMRQITGNIMKVNRSLDVAMKSMSPERVCYPKTSS